MRKQTCRSIAQAVVLMISIVCAIAVVGATGLGASIPLDFVLNRDVLLAEHQKNITAAGAWLNTLRLEGEHNGRIDYRISNPARFVEEAVYRGEDDPYLILKMPSLLPSSRNHEDRIAELARIERAREQAIEAAADCALALMEDDEEDYRPVPDPGTRLLGQSQAELLANEYAQAESRVQMLGQLAEFNGQIDYRITDTEKVIEEALYRDEWDPFLIESMPYRLAENRSTEDRSRELRTIMERRTALMTHEVARESSPDPIQGTFSDGDWSSSETYGYLDGFFSMYEAPTPDPTGVQRLRFDFAGSVSRFAATRAGREWGRQIAQASFPFCAYIKGALDLNDHGEVQWEVRQENFFALVIDSSSGSMKQRRALSEAIFRVKRYVARKQSDLVKDLEGRALNLQEGIRQLEEIRRIQRGLEQLEETEDQYRPELLELMDDGTNLLERRAGVIDAETWELIDLDSPMDYVEFEAALSASGLMDKLVEFAESYARRVSTSLGYELADQLDIPAAVRRSFKNGFTAGFKISSDENLRYCSCEDDDLGTLPHDN